jgi:hypothetical protein
MAPDMADRSGGLRKTRSSGGWSSPFNLLCFEFTASFPSFPHPPEIPRFARAQSLAPASACHAASAPAPSSKDSPTA